MVRKLAAFGFSFALAELCCAYLPLPALVPMAALLVLLAAVRIVLRIRKKKKLPSYLAIFAGLLLGAAWFGAYRTAAVKPVLQLAGRTVTCTVTVETDQAPSYEDGMARGTLHVTTIGGKRADIYCYSDAFPDYAPGERFTAKFALSELEADSYRMGRHADKIYLAAEYAGEAVVEAASSSPVFALYRLRRSLAQRMYYYLPRTEGGIAAAVLLGEKSGLDAAVANTFRAAGVSHLLSVSGLHLALLCGLLFLGMGQKLRFSRPAILLQSAFAVFYMLLTGCSSSILRAGCVFLYVQLGCLLLLPPDLLTGTGLVLMLLGIFDPYAVCDVGLQLSICAVLGIQLSAVPVEKLRGAIRSRRGRIRPDEVTLRDSTLKQLVRLGQAALAAAFAALATFPVLVAHGMAVSGVGVLTNLLVTWALAPILILGCGCLLLSFFSPLGPCMHFFSFLLGAALRGIVAVVSRCAGLPMARLALPRRYALFAFAVLALLLLVLWKGNCLFRGLPLLAGAAVLAVCLGVMFSRNVVRVALVGSAASPCAVITQNGEAVVLFRGGASNQKKVLEYLAEQGGPQEIALIDLRQDPRSMEFTADAVYQLDTMEDAFGTQVPLLRDVQAELYHTAETNLAVLAVAGYHIGISAGASSAKLSAVMDLYLAGSAYPENFTAGTLLFKTRRPRWEKRVASETLYFGQDVPTAVIRPGASVIFEGANRYALQ